MSGLLDVTKLDERNAHGRHDRPGRIINISSIRGEAGNIGQANYAASKSGLFGLTMSLAQETARKGITVNSVAPGYISTAASTCRRIRAR